LTQKGIQLVKECEKLGILLDVSHLSVKSFWDVTQYAASGVFASHSNVKDICNHPRNLSADQIDYLIHSKGMIGLTFVPAFVHNSGHATIHDLLMHIEYICERGGAYCVGLGSDFDGIDRTVAGLEHPGKYEQFRNELSQHYRESDIENWMYKNWFTFLNNQLSD
jgi:membrane dipeptidase